MMQEILQKYQDRLVNISGRNRSLVLKRLYKKRAFDIMQLDQFHDGFSSQVKSFLFENGRKKLLLLDDPYREQQNNEKMVRANLERQYESQQASLRQSFESEGLEEALKQLEIDYKLDLEQALEEVAERHKSLVSIGQGINHLYREISSVERETGRRELFVGYPFVEGKLVDGSFIRAPLMLFPVGLVKDKNKWYLTDVEGASPQLNKVLVFSHSKANESLPPELEWEVDVRSRPAREVISSTIRYLNDYGMSIGEADNLDMQRFRDYTANDTPDYSLGTLVLKNHLILGQFPTSNSIYEDYNQLKQRQLERSPISELLDSRNSTSPDTRESGEPIKEKDYFFISPLDHSQEKAVQKVNGRGHLVIHGPPGTGKSETIANIITDCLAKGKRVLMVSQKRAALDVVYNRLSALHSKLVLVHDGAADKRAFYNHVSNSLEAVTKRSSYTRQRAMLLGQQIDGKLKTLQRSWTTLHSLHDSGLSLQQLYVKCSCIDQAPLAGLLAELSRDNCLEDVGYDDLKAAQIHLGQTGKLEAYVEFEELSKNPLLRFVKRGVDKTGVLIAEETLRCFDYDRFLDLRNNEWFMPILLRLKEAEFPQSQEELEQIGIDFIAAQFPDLLQQCCDGRWWTPKYWLNYRRNREQQKENDVRYRECLEQTKWLTTSILHMREEVRRELQPLSHVFSTEGIELFVELFLESDNNKTVLEKIRGTIPEVENYSVLATKVAHLSQMERTLAECVRKHMTRTNNTVVQALHDVVQAYLVYALRAHESTLGVHDLLVSGDSYERIQMDIRDLMQQKRDSIPQVIIGDWSSRFLTEAANRKNMEYHANKKSHLWPLRRYVSQFTDDILNLFPCWLMGPEAISDILPLNPGMFDIIIFDEASQMFVENAIPAIYRAKQVVVAGDAKQLRPDDLFLGRVEDDPDAMGSDMVLPAEEVDSLLDLAVANCEGVYLNYHYRSRYAELINFSNYGFYRAQLQISPNNDMPQKPPIERIKVDGKWSTRRDNFVEAEKVVEIIDHLLRTRKQRETIGVVTFNHTQKELIQDLLDHRSSTDPGFSAMYSEEQDRQEGNQDAGLFVKNIENVQGDERDIIIFSVGYGPDEHNRVRAHFGSLNREGGANRLNVAVSRAKKKIYLVTSIEPEELNVEKAKHEGPKFLKAYLAYARAISAGDLDGAHSILNSLLDTGVDLDEQELYDSEFEEQVATALRSRGYHVYSQVGVSGYRIDLGIYDESSSRFILGIECDGATYHSSKSARERDIQRQMYLESRGWKIARVWSTDWWKNPKDETRRLVQIIEAELARQRKTKEQFTAISPVPNLGVEAQETPKHTKTVHAGDKAQLVAKATKGQQTLTFSSIDKGRKVSFGDRVWLTQTDGSFVFHLDLEDNPHNRHLMKDYEQALLGKRLNDEIHIVDHVYRISKIEPA